LELASTRCHGYANGCSCPRCSDRAEGVANGQLVFDASGKLRYRSEPTFEGWAAVRRYAIDRDRARHRIAA
jgi:hypothetical protein